MISSCVKEKREDGMKLATKLQTTRALSTNRGPIVAFEIRWCTATPLKKEKGKRDIGALPICQIYFYLNYQLQASLTMYSFFASGKVVLRPPYHSWRSHAIPIGVLMSRKVLIQADKHVCLPAWLSEHYHVRTCRCIDTCTTVVCLETRNTSFNYQLRPERVMYQSFYPTRLNLLSPLPLRRCLLTQDPFATLDVESAMLSRIPQVHQKLALQRETKPTCAPWNDWR